MAIYKYYEVDYACNPWEIKGPEIAESFEEMEYDTDLDKDDWAQDCKQDGEYEILDPDSEYLEEYQQRFPQLTGYRAIEGQGWYLFFKKEESNYSHAT